jgi:hypothetical protein
MTLELGVDIAVFSILLAMADASPKHQRDTQHALVRQDQGTIILDPAQVDTPIRTIKESRAQGSCRWFYSVID